MVPSLGAKRRISSKLHQRRSCAADAAWPAAVERCCGRNWRGMSMAERKKARQATGLNLFSEENRGDRHIMHQGKYSVIIEISYNGYNKVRILAVQLFLPWLPSAYAQAARREGADHTRFRRSARLRCRKELLSRHARTTRIDLHGRSSPVQPCHAILPLPVLTMKSMNTISPVAESPEDNRSRRHRSPPPRRAPPPDAAASRGRQTPSRPPRPRRRQSRRAPCSSSCSSNSPPSAIACRWRSASTSRCWPACPA